MIKVEGFEKTLYEDYQVTSKKYEFNGDNSWKVWVNKIEIGEEPYFIIYATISDFHE